MNLLPYSPISLLTLIAYLDILNARGEYTINTIYSSVSEITSAIKTKTEDFLSLSITFDEYQSYIREVTKHKRNRALVFNGNDKYAASFEKGMGKKRLLELKKALVSIDPYLFSDLP